MKSLLFVIGAMMMVSAACANTDTDKNNKELNKSTELLVDLAEKPKISVYNLAGELVKEVADEKEDRVLLMKSDLVFNDGTSKIFIVDVR